MSLRKGMIFLLIFVLISLWLSMNSVSEAQPFTYIPNFDDGTVSVIETETDTVISTVAVAVEPTSVAAHPDGSRIYVTHGQAGGNIISLIDTFTNKTVATFASGGLNPMGAAIHPDGTRLYVTNSGNGALTVIDTATNQVAATVRGMNSPVGVAVHPDGTRVYVANNGIGQPVSVIDAATNTVIATVGMGSPTLLSVLPNGSKVYVTNMNDGHVSVIDTTTNTIKTTIGVGLEPCGVTPHPDGTKVYVGNLGDNTVSVIDTSTDKVIATIPVAARPCHVAVHPDGTRVYIAHDLSTGNNISVISTVTNAVIGTIKVGSGPQGIAFSLPNEIIKLLRSAGPDYWAVLGLGGNGTSLSMSGSSSIVGTVANAGVAKAGSVNMSGTSTIQGTLFLNTSGSLNKSGSATVVGGVKKDAATDAVLNQAVADAKAASQTAASLPATITSVTSITISNPSQNKTILGGLRTNVLKLTNVAISNGTLTLSAPSGGQFIINISGNFALSGGSKIALSGGLTLYDVLFNFTGTGSVALSGGSTVSGIILAPTRQIALSSSFITGAVIAGGSQIASSGGQINNLEQFKATISAVPILGPAPLQVQFNAIAQGGVPPYTYAWDLDGNGTTDDTRRAFVYTYQQPGIYHVTLRINDSKGNQVSATVVINATMANRNPVANPGGPYSGLINVPVQFNGSGSSDPDGDPITYSWNFGDGATGSGVNPVHTYASAGTYTVSLTVYDNRGGSGTAQTTAQINNPVPTISSISPPSKTYGDLAFTMTVYGTNFVPMSAVNFNGSVRATTFVSTTQLTASISASDLSTAGSFPITVSNRAPGGGTSNALSFTVNMAFPTITVTGGTFPYDGSVHPASATATGVGGSTVSGSFTYTYNGLPAEPINAGSYAVVANFTSSDPNYTNATGNGSIVITFANQTISFGPLSDKTYDDPPFAVSATASSTLTVSFASQTPLTCSVSGTTVTILDVGVCTIRASQAGNSNYNAAPPVDQSFNVTPGALRHFAIGAISSPQTAGTAFSITITAQDKGNHTVTNFSGTVEITSTGALSSGGGTSGAFVNGVLSSHSVRISNTGSFTITATRTGGTEAGTSNSFTVNPGALSSFLVEASGGGTVAPQTAGTPFSIQITARDQYNNTVTSFTGTVQITSNGVLLGTPLTSGAFVSGVLASQSITIISAQLGTTLSATDTVSGANGTSNGFTVNPAGLGNFLIEASTGGSIGPQTAGTPFGIKITARDSYNNVITTFSGAVTLEAEIGAISPNSVTFYGNEGGFLTVDVALTHAATPQTVTAISGGHQGTSNDFTVNPAGLGNFLIEASAGGNIGPQTVGAPFGIKVTARDSYNNVITTFSGTVALNTNAGSITPSSIAFTGSEGGVLFTSVTVTQSGVDETITATSDIYNGQSNPFTVNAGPLDHFKVEAAGGGDIPDQTAWVSFSIQITAQDANNNTVTGFNGTVDITSAGNLALGGGTTEAFANGVLASHDVAISVGGSFTITATRTGGTETGTSNAFTVINPVPILSSINPTSITAGSPDFTLILTGDNFLTTSIVTFNNQQVSSQYISKTQLQATIPAAAVTTAGSYPVNVTNPAPGGGSAAPLAFAVSNPAPSLTSMNPSSITAGSPDFTLTLTGDNFSTNSIVSFNNQQYPATYISKNQITATIPATAVTATGSYPVMVINPAPGGGQTAPLQFTVMPLALAPVITGFTPSQGPVGTAVTINGNNFDVTGLRVSLNGTAAVVSSFTKTSITTTVPMGAATGPITVTTSGGAGTSASGFTVTSLYNFGISITPQNIKAAPNSQVTYIISATGSDNFSNLITLNIQGLPDGFTALFSPKTITKGQSANLTITTCNCTLSSPAALTITGSSVIDGNSVTQSVGASLDMTAQGETTLTGLVLNTDGNPIKGVAIRIGSASAFTDESGNFVFEHPPTGQQVVLIDGYPASTDTYHYPTIPITMNIMSGQTNTLPFVPHLHFQKDYDFTQIDRSVETVAEDPDTPGLQLRIPAGVDIIGWDGNPNTKVSIRQVPIDALPVPPPPPNVQGRSAYMFYFGKMGGGVPTIPIPVTAPNDLGIGPGKKAELWYYNESPNLGEAPNDWALAGTCTVSDDGETISTDPGVGIPRFCCGIIILSPSEKTGPNVPPDPCKQGKHSVDPSSGVFIHEETDLVVPGRIPVVLTRYHRNMDTWTGTFGIGTYLNYDQYLFYYGDTAALVMPYGTRINFTRQPNGDYVNISEPKFRGAVVRGTSLQMKDGTTYKFDLYNILTEISDRYGNKLKFNRGLEGGMNLTSIVDGTGKTLVTVNTTAGLFRDVITQVTDFTGRNVTYTYDYSADPGTGRLMSVTNPEGGVTQYQYDSQGRMASITDPRGNNTVNVSYDGNGRVCQEQYADGGAYKYYYITVDQATRPPAMKLLAEAKAGGPISTPACSAAYTISAVAYTIAVDPNGNPTTYRFNNYQHIISATDANGQTTLTERDPVTNLIKSRTDALGRKTSYTYDNNGNVTSITDPVGNTTTMVYDQTLNKPVKITDALGNVTTMTYDANGNLIQLRTPNSELTTISYNRYGQPISVNDPMGNIITSEYDAYGNLVKATDPLGNSATMQYDTLSRLIQTTDAKGRPTTYSYDLMNRVTELKDALNGSTKSTYDLNGNLLSMTDAKGQTTSYTYNSKNQVVNLTDQLGKTETYAYDINDNLIRRTDRKGQITTNSYDNMNRLKKVDYADGSYTENTFDAVGRLISINDSISGPIQYVYSDTGCSTCGGVADQVIQETAPLGSISYTYDALGRRTSMIVAGQPTVDYQYDASSRLAEIDSLINGVATGFSLRYDALGRRTSLTSPNGVTTNYTYDNASNLIDLKHLSPLNQILESINYTYDANGNSIAVNRANIPVKLPDPRSNITFNSANQMLAFNDKSLSYDENGNLTSVTNACGSTTYTWNPRNRLIGIKGFIADCSPLIASFKYDALGRRIEKTINGRTIQYLYDGLDIVQEMENGAVSTNYLRTLNIDEPLARLTLNAPRFYHTDALGSVVALTDETGSIRTQYTYDPFGNVTVSGETSDNPSQYTGRENDETGLYYYRSRYYSPQLQRFISEDPIGFEGGDVNLYPYTQNNPVDNVDPFGLCKCKEFILESEGIRIAQEAKRWEQTPYKSPGHARGVGADCTGSTWQIYNNAGYSYVSERDLMIANNFNETSTNCKMQKVDTPQIGDVVKFSGHIAIYDPTIGTTSDLKGKKVKNVLWTTHGTNQAPGKYGVGPIEYFVGTPNYYRFCKTSCDN